MKTILVILAFFILPGCATLVNGDTVPIAISADEPDISLRANGQTFTLPAVVSMPRGQGDQIIEFVKGDTRQSYVLKEAASWWILGNSIYMLLGIVFIAVDASNPHGWTLNPDEIRFSFASGVNGDLIAKEEEPEDQY